MAGAGQPALLIPAGTSPHGAALRPSQAATLNSADLVIWVGPELESRLGRSIAALADQARVLRLRDDGDIGWLLARAGGHHHHDDHDRDDDDRGYDDHDRDDDDHDHDDHDRDDDDHDHDDHDRDDDDHDHDDYDRDDDDRDHDDHDHDDHDRDDDDHDHDDYDRDDDRDHDDHDRDDDDRDHDDHDRDDDDHHGTHHDHDSLNMRDKADLVDGERDHRASAQESIGRIDPHLWLDPQRAAVFARSVARALAEMDPEHAALYRQNAHILTDALVALDGEIADILRPVTQQGFVVAHDAYQYFEDRYRLSPLGFVAISPDQPTGAASMQALRNAIAAYGPVCLFTETQFSPRIAQTLAAEFGLQMARLDPLGPPKTAMSGISDTSPSHTVELGTSFFDQSSPNPVIVASRDYFAMMRHLAGTMAACLSSLPRRS